MTSQYTVSDVPGAFSTLIGNTPVRFEPCGGQCGGWRALPGVFGLVEIWGRSYSELRREVDAIYARPVVHARECES